MPQKIKNSKGVLLIITMGLIFFMALATTGMFMLLKFQSERAKRWLDITKAYYLCEAGISMAMFDMKEGLLAGAPCEAAPCERKFVYSIMGEEPHDVYYRVKKISGTYTVTGVTRSPYGLTTSITDTIAGDSLTNIYKLDAGGRRAFPIFMLHRPGG